VRLTDGGIDANSSKREHREARGPHLEMSVRRFVNCQLAKEKKKNSLNARATKKQSNEQQSLVVLFHCGTSKKEERIMKGDNYRGWEIFDKSVSMREGP